MDVLNKTFARLSDWYRSLTPGARIAAGALLVVCAASVAYLFNQQYAASETYLFGGEPVSASQLPAMLQAFATAGLTDYEMQDNRIRVPHAKQAVYMGALANAGALPNNFGDSLRKMLDKSSGPWIGKRQQEEMSKIALQDELTKIINSMPGIESASVLYNVETEQGLHTRKQITASVNVKPSGNQLLSVRQVDMIRHVVGPPIGIDPQCVAIVDFNGATYSARAPSTGGAAELDRFAKTKLEYEQKYTEKIREALSFVPGALVSVNVELPADLEGPENSTRNDLRSTPSEATKAVGGGVNEPAAIKSIVDAVVGPTQSNKGAVNGPGHNAAIDSRPISKAGLTPKRVTVSVGIPSSHYEEVWRQRNPAAADSKSLQPNSEALRQIEAEVSANIKQQVAHVVPWPEEANQDRAQLVTVTTFQNLPAARAEHRAATDHHATWLDENGTTAGVALVAAVSLLAVRWIVRSSSAEKTNAALRLAHDTLDDENLSGRETIGRFRGTNGPSLREELAGIVHDDPDSAASVLRNWIGSAS